MSRKAASFTQADIRRALAAFKAEGIEPEVVIEDRRARVIRRQDNGADKGPKKPLAPRRELVL